MGAKRNEHDEIVYRHLDERINRVAVGEITPNEDHCGAGRGGEDDETGGVILAVSAQSTRRKRAA